MEKMRISIVGKVAGNERLRFGPHSMRTIQGFSYVLVLAAVVVIGIVAEAGYLTTWRAVKADREAELLFRGNAYRRAIQSYYEAGDAVKTFPRHLEDLIKDPRFPNKHYLRDLYADPMAPGHSGEWRLIPASDGGIAGVASTSSETPLKRANFPKGLEKFAGAASYSDWIFEYTAPPPKAATPPSRRPADPFGAKKTF